MKPMPFALINRTLICCLLILSIPSSTTAGTIADQYPCYSQARNAEKETGAYCSVGIPRKQMNSSEQLNKLITCLGQTAAIQNRTILIALETEVTPNKEYESPLHKNICSLFLRETDKLKKSLSKIAAVNIIMVTGNRDTLASKISTTIKTRSIQIRDIVIFASTDSVGLENYDIFRPVNNNKSFMAAVELTELGIYYENRAFNPIWSLHIQEMFLLSMELAMGYALNKAAESKARVIASYDRSGNKVILVPDIK